MSNNVILKQGTCEMCKLVKPALKFEIVDQEQLIICSDCSNIVEGVRAISDINAKQEAKTGYIVEIAELLDDMYGLPINNIYKIKTNGDIVKTVKREYYAPATFGETTTLALENIPGYYISKFEMPAMTMSGYKDSYDPESPTTMDITLMIDTSSGALFVVKIGSVPDSASSVEFNTIAVTGDFVKEDPVSEGHITFEKYMEIYVDIPTFIYNVTYTKIEEW